MSINPSLQNTITILYGDRVVTILESQIEANDLWITAEDLKRVNDFELKPSGACLDEICIPVNHSGDDALLRVSEERTWFNLTGFARKLGQAFIADTASNVWSFGEITAARGSFFNDGIAPDFAIPDRTGKQVSLSDFLGKKVLLLTWASW
jgi:AhpC/TSA family